MYDNEGHIFDFYGNINFKGEIYDLAKNSDARDVMNTSDAFDRDHLIFDRKYYIIIHIS